MGCGNFRKKLRVICNVTGLLASKGQKRHDERITPDFAPLADLVAGQRPIGYFLARHLQRFLYRIYTPGLTVGVIAGLWVSVGRVSLPMFEVGAGATLLWVLFVSWWGHKRQARKLARLDALLAQLETP